MGGVATYVAKQDHKETLKINEGTEDNEYIVTRHSQFRKPINIINVYGELNRELLPKSLTKNGKKSSRM